MKRKEKEKQEQYELFFLRAQAGVKVLSFRTDVPVCRILDRRRDRQRPVRWPECSSHKSTSRSILGIELVDRFLG